jgi:hypothetical protein
MEENYIIPRNIRVREEIGFGLNAKQVLYVVLGVGGVVSTLATPLPLDLKIIGSILSIGSSLLFAIGRLYGQEADRYIYNSIKYPLRTKVYEEKEGGLVVAQKTVNQVRINIR